MQQRNSEKAAEERASLQVIEGGKKKARPNRATAMNQWTRRSIWAMVLEGELDITSPRQLHHLSGGMPFGKIIGALRETYREKMYSPTTPAGQQRRVA